MLALLDVHYLDTRARAGCGLARRWTDPSFERSWTVEVEGVLPYEPGHFARRELPCLLAALRGAGPEPLEAIVIDGYVWLDEGGTKGLGAHLHDAVAGRTAVVGIAKTSYRGSPMAARVLRGASTSPVYVTAAGMEREVAAQHVAAMAGPGRLPELVRAVDRLCRLG